MASKEEIYDEKINPLMAQIIAICKEHKIAVARLPGGFYF